MAEVARGETAFLLEVPLERLGEAEALGPGGAYYLARHAARSGAAERVEALLLVEASANAGLAGRLALADLSAALASRADWSALVALASRFPGRLESDPKQAKALLEAYYRTGGDVPGLSLYAAIRGRPPYAYRKIDALGLLMALRSGQRPPAAGLAAMILGPAEAEALIVLDDGLPLGLRSESTGQAALAYLGDSANFPRKARTLIALLSARRYMAEKEYHKAKDAYAALFTYPADKGSFPDPSLEKLHPDLISEAGRAYYFAAAAKEGATILAAAAVKATDPATSVAALLSAARCLRAEGRKEEALKAYRAVLGSAPAGRLRDAAAWYVADMAGESGKPGRAVDELVSSAPLWEDASYFADIAGSLVGACVKADDFAALERMAKALRGRMGSTFDARAYYVLARAAALGMYSPDSPPRRPEPLPAALSYYAILIALMEGIDPAAERGLAAGSLAKGDGRAQATAATARDDAMPFSEAGAFLAGMVRYGLGDELSRLPPSLVDAASPAELRAVARMDMARGELAEAVRLYGRLSSRAGFSPEPGDMEILYPMGFRPEMEGACAESGLPLDLLCALVRTESFFDPAAGSTAGARGLAQLMPETAKAVASQIGIASPDLADPATNLRLGSRYLADLLKRFGGDLLVALMSYNGGPTRVAKAFRESPGLSPDLLLETLPMDETREYGRKVLAARAVYGYLIDAKDFSGTVEDFLPGFPSR